jgi:glycerophosphoryl diester phosphodiesterase
MRLGKYIAITGLLGVFFFACQKEIFVIENLSGNKIQVVGHAGMGFNHVLPKNSYEAFMKALNLGADGVEFDVQMTKDSVLVLYHDGDLSTMTNMKGKIHTYLWSELQNCRLKSTRSPFLAYSLISLDDFFANVPNLHRYSYTFDNKINPEFNDSLSVRTYINTHINALIRLVEKYNLSENIFIESHNEYFLTTLKTLKPNYKLFIYPETTFEDGFRIAINLNLYGITIENNHITKEQVRLAHQNNIRITVFDATTNAENVDAIRKNPDIIQTNNLTHLLKMLK